MKDYSSYFKKPSLNEAKRRSRDQVRRYDDAYHVPLDMVKAGIVDPAKVTRSALQNAASIASLVLTTETIVADKVDENAAVPAMPPMGGMGGMM